LDGGGDHLCVDTASGQLISFFHDDSSRIIEYPNLERMLEIYVLSLEAKMWHVNDGRLEPLNPQRLDEFVKRLNPGYPIIVRSSLVD
jgi:hypothetical protein